MDFKLLFTPLKIGKITTKNRISFSAHLTNYSHKGLPTQQLINYLVARARGGTGLIITEEQSVHPTDTAYEKGMHAYVAGVIPEYKRLTRSVHQYEAPIFAQLNHNGQQCDGTLSRKPVWAPSPVPDVMFREIPKQMEEEDIAEIVEAYHDCALNVREGGFDGIEIQMAHSSLIRQFLSPLTNKRQDHYGGSFYNRTRFALEVLSAVRRAVGDDYTVGVRLCADEFMPGGLTIDDAKDFARLLEGKKLVDFFNISVGTFLTLYLVGGSMHIPPGHTVSLSSEIKSVVSLPVFAAGRINDPYFADRILVSGQADMIGIVRGQICDADFANKARAGRIQEIQYCVSDNQGCYGRVGLNKPMECIQNPSVGSEEEFITQKITATQYKKRVMVVGAGPAGMRAARVAAERGHKVDLYEKENKVGGQLLIAKMGSGREEMGMIIQNELNHLRKYSINIIYQKEVDKEFVLSKNKYYDAVIIATGSSFDISSLPFGIDSNSKSKIFSIPHVFEDKIAAYSNILFIDYDNGHRATSTIEYLLDLKKKVHVISPALFIGADLAPTNDLFLTRQRLLKKGVSVTNDTIVTEVKDGNVHTLNYYLNEIKILSDCDYDCIVAAVNNVANDSLYYQLKNLIDDIYCCGDCVSPRKIDMAIREGHYAGSRV
ncbi:MAG: mycofactocin system FadH/OYE family oxidoreductase 2 [Oligoflexia bacterium]|nr:mycofactocin system FadH/OYE family oxidoreductase 2 [Oligoflexia bacterium]